MHDKSFFSVFQFAKYTKNCCIISFSLQLIKTLKFLLKKNNWLNSYLQIEQSIQKKIKDSFKPESQDFLDPALAKHQRLHYVTFILWSDGMICFISSLLAFDLMDKFCPCFVLVSKSSQKIPDQHFQFAINYKI